MLANSLRSCAKGSRHNQWLPVFLICLLVCDIPLARGGILVTYSYMFSDCHLSHTFMEGSLRASRRLEGVRKELGAHLWVTSKLNTYLLTFTNLYL